MDNFIYTATSGASRSLLAQTVHSNNLANANTTGFRKDFEYAQSIQLNGSGFDGRHLSKTNSASTNFNIGEIVETGRDLDVAISGNGFFSVLLPDGTESNTRMGNLKLDAAGNLTANGFPVVGDGGLINIPEFQKLDISEKGIISITPAGGGEILEVAQLKLVNPDIQQIQKNELGLFSEQDGLVLDFAPEVKLVPRHLEQSNVSTINELTQVMSLTRNFEMHIKMMKTAESIAQAGNKLINSR